MASSKQKGNSELQKWLMQLLGAEFDPNTQLDDQEIEYLLSLKSKNEEVEKNAREEIKLKKARIHSIHAKTEELKTLLENEDISLGEETWKQADCIAGLAAKMNIEEPDPTNFLLAICNMKNDKFKYEEQRKRNCDLLSFYSQENLKIKKTNDVLKSQLDALKKVIDIQQSNEVKIAENIRFFNTKSSQYGSNIKLTQDGLKAIDFEESIQHNSLVEWSEAIKDLEEKLNVSKDELKYYRNLPPDETLTRLKIEEKRGELIQLEKDFRSLLYKWENYNEDMNTNV